MGKKDEEYRSHYDYAFKILQDPRFKKMLNITDEAALGETYDFYVTAIFPLYPHADVAAFISSRDSLVSTNAKVKDLDVNKVIDDSYVQDAEKRKVAEKP